MRSRCLLLFAPILIASPFVFAGCGDHDGYDGRYGNQNEILFGIRQKVDTANGGKKEVTAGYEFLGLANKGGWDALAFRDGDGEGTCYFERYDNRLGQPRVESGVATFSGGKLPAPGLQILANQVEPKKATDGWATDDSLSFSASGFAMPTIPSATMNAPATDLTIGDITPAPAKKEAQAGTAAGTTGTTGATEEIALKTTDDITVKWTAIEEKVPTRVMISLETDETPEGATEHVPGGNVRCFNMAKSASAIIPRDWVARLFSSVDPAKPIKGTLEISTHRQLTIRAKSSWTVYVVATNEHRTIAFTGTR